MAGANPGEKATTVKHNLYIMDGGREVTFRHAACTAKKSNVPVRVHSTSVPCL